MDEYTLLGTHGEKWHLFFLLLPGLLESYPKIFAQNNVKNFPPTLSSGSLMVSGITLRSLIHFEFIFVYDIRIQFHSSVCGYPFFSTPFT